jgi:hypothetical protein
MGPMMQCISDRGAGRHLTCNHFLCLVRVAMMCALDLLLFFALMLTGSRGNRREGMQYAECPDEHVLWSAAGLRSASWTAIATAMRDD